MEQWTVVGLSLSVLYFPGGGAGENNRLRCSWNQVWSVSGLGTPQIDDRWLIPRRLKATVKIGFGAIWGFAWNYKWGCRAASFSFSFSFFIFEIGLLGLKVIIPFYTNALRMSSILFLLCLILMGYGWGEWWLQEKVVDWWSELSPEPDTGERERERR